MSQTLDPPVDVVLSIACWISFTIRAERLRAKAIVRFDCPQLSSLAGPLTNPKLSRITSRVSVTTVPTFSLSSSRMDATFAVVLIISAVVVRNGVTVTTAFFSDVHGNEPVLISPNVNFTSVIICTYGEKVGTGDGTGVGTMEGIGVGIDVGRLDGRGVGIADGSGVGGDEGGGEGTGDGRGEGCMLGRGDGNDEIVGTGEMVGSAIGLGEGMIVGSIVGVRVGEAVGIGEGRLVGDTVGKGDGS